MTEGYPPPDYIANNWSEELFNLMVEKLGERLEPKSGGDNRVVSDDALLKEMGIKVGGK